MQILDVFGRFVQGVGRVAAVLAVAAFSAQAVA